MKQSKEINDSILEPVEFARRVRLFEINGESFGSLEEDKVIPYWEPKQLVDVMEKSHANAAIFRAIDSNLMTFYPSNVLPRNTAIGNRDLLGEMAELCKQKKMHLIAYCCVGGAIHKDAVASYGDWSMINEDQSRVVKTGDWADEPQLIICINNPDYIQAYKQAIREVVSQYAVSGIFIDGPAERRRCYCSYCKQLFRQKYNEELPVYFDKEYDKLEAPVKHKLLDFHKSSMDEILAQIREVILTEKNIPIVSVIGTQTKRFIRYGFMKHSDGAMASDMESTDYMDALMRIKSGAAFQKAVWVYCPITPRQTLMTFQDHDIELSSYLALAHGATPQIVTLDSYIHDEKGLQSIQNLFADMDKNEHLFFEQKSVPHIALLCSEQTGLYYASSEDYPFNRGSFFVDYSDQEVGNWHNHYFEGAFAALTHAHRQFDVILDEDLTLEKLQQYKVLVLPNVACLSIKQAETIIGFVKNGGGLITSYETSLYDEHGNKREDFLLKDLIKASYVAKEDLSLKRNQFKPEPYIRITKHHPITEGQAVDSLIAYDFKGMARNYAFIEKDELNKGSYQDRILSVKLLADASVIADFYYPAGGEFGQPYTFPAGHPESIICSEYGKGKVVYFAQPLDLLYQARGFQVLRSLLANAADWVSTTKPPFQLEGPLSVISHLTEGENQRALHLINFTGNLSQTLNYKAEYIAPIYHLNIAITIPEEKTVVKVSLLHGEQELEFSMSDRECHIRLPELHVYHCVIVSYK